MNGILPRRRCSTRSGGTSASRRPRGPHHNGRARRSRRDLSPRGALRSIESRGEAETSASVLARPGEPRPATLGGEAGSQRAPSGRGGSDPPLGHLAREVENRLASPRPADAHPSPRPDPHARGRAGPRRMAAGRTHVPSRVSGDDLRRRSRRSGRQQPGVCPLAQLSLDRRASSSLRVHAGELFDRGGSYASGHGEADLTSLCVPGRKRRFAPWNGLISAAGPKCPGRLPGRSTV